MPFNIRSSGSYYATFDDSGLSANRTYTLPNQSGALLTTSATASRAVTSSFAVTASYALSSAGGNGDSPGAPTAVIVKTADESVTNSQTNQPDDHLFYAVTAGRHYMFITECIWVRATTGTGQLLRTAFNGQSEGMCYVQDNVTYALADGASSVNSPTVTAGFQNVTLITRQIAVVTPTYDRTVGFSWSQGASGANTVTLKKGSRMLVYDMGAV